MTDETQYELPGFNVLLMGESGAGKTHSIRTLVEAGLEVFCIFTEPGMDILADIPSDKLHWAYTPPSTQSFENFLKTAEKVSKMSWSLIKEQTNDPDKSKHNGFVKLAGMLYNYVDARTGKEYGSIDSWDQSRVLVIDSLSGLNQMVMQFITGMSIAKSQPQWGAAMGQELNLINKLCYDTTCHFVMMAHVSKEIDTINGGLVITANALGRKNAPEIPKNFTDVILARREGMTFTWSTMADHVETKPRNLPFSDKLKPSFVPLYDNWLARAIKGEEK